MMRTYSLFILASLVLMFSCQEDCPDDMGQGPGDPNDSCSASMPVGEDFVIDVPFYVTDQMFIPDDNPMKVAAVELGRFLFWETKLSGDNTMSCGTCHAPENAFADPVPVSVGIDGIAGTRNTMALVNLVFEDKITWDGAQEDLEAQSIEPVINPIEMHDVWEDVVIELQNDSLYPPLFEAAFGTECVTPDRSSKAIAQFIRTMVSFNSKFDRVLFGPEQFTPLEQLGFDIWDDEGGNPDVVYGGQNGADCFHCHTLDNYRMTDNTFRNNGLDSVFTDLGRGEVTGLPQDMGKFKTVNLRNIALSAPYMHDGRFETLEDVVEHYDSGGFPSATLDVNMKFSVGGLALSAQKKAALVAFMNTFTDMEFVENPEFQDPH